MKKYKDFERECDVSYKGHCKMYTAARRDYISKDKQKRLNKSSIQAESRNTERSGNRQNDKKELRYMMELFNNGAY